MHVQLLKLQPDHLKHTNAANVYRSRNLCTQSPQAGGKAGVGEKHSEVHRQMHTHCYSGTRKHNLKFHITIDTKSDWDISDDLAQFRASHRSRATWKLKVASRYDVSMKKPGETGLAGSVQCCRLRASRKLMVARG